VSLMCGEITVGYRCAGRNHSSRSIDMRLPSLILPFTVFALITRENSEAENREGSEGNSMGLILDARSSTQPLWVRAGEFPGLTPIAVSKQPDSDTLPPDGRDARECSVMMKSK